MRVKLKLTVVVVGLCLLLQGPIFAQTFPTAKELVAKLNIGWNIGNTLESTWGDASGETVVNQRLIDSVKAAGFNAIRIPVAWDFHSTNGTIDAAWIARVKQVVDYCTGRGLYTIINIHWDKGWLENNCTTSMQASVNAKQKSYWTQIANYFKAYDEHLLFASANEPAVSDATGMTVLLSYHQTFIDAVRATGGNNSQRILIVQGPTTDTEKTLSLMNTMPTDKVADKMIVEVHYYSPYQYCLMTADANWGSQFYYWGKCFHSTTDAGRNPTWGEEAYMEQQFKDLKAKFIDKGYPLIIGECGVNLRKSLTGANYTLHKASREYYLRYFSNACRRYGILPFYWDPGFQGDNSTTIFDRATGAVTDRDALNALMYGTYSTSTTAVSCNVNDCKGTYNGNAYTNKCGTCVLGYSAACNGTTTNPTVNITAPANNSIYAAPASIAIAATAIPSGTNTISKVEFYNGTAKLGEDATSPYNYSWTNVAAGTYSITAVATDNAGNKTTSTAVSVKVNVPQAAYGGTPWPIPGKIEFESYDVGGNGFAYLDNTAGNIGGATTFRTPEEVDVEACTDAGTGYNIGYATAGEWMEYTVNVAAAGKYDLTLRVACNGDGRTVSISAKDVVVAKDVAIPNTAGWQTWQDVVVKDIALEAGVQIIRVTMGATDYVNMNYMTFAAQSQVKPSLTLKAGWNLIGCPLNGSTDIATALAPVWSSVLVVKNMESFYDKSQGAAFNQLTKLEWGQGYWVKVSKECVLSW